MFTTRNSLIAAALLLGSSVAAEHASAGSYGHIDSLASRIQNNAALLNQEFRLHYAHVPGYHDLLAQSKYVFLRAQHIHVLVHHGGSPYYMTNDLRVLDHSFHNLEALLQKIEFLVHRGQFGHIHGRISHVHMLMNQIGSDIHHLRSDIAELTRSCQHSHVVHYVRPPRDYGEVRSGWTRTLSNIEGGRSRSNDSGRRRGGQGSDNRRSLSSR